MRMSIKPKGLGGIIILVTVIAIGAVVTYSTGIAHSRSATRIGYVGNDGWSSWNGTYKLLDGKMRRTLHFDSPQNIALETKTESGTLSIDIQDASGNAIFSKSNIGTASQSISVDGNIVVTISADKHCGSFSIG